MLATYIPNDGNNSIIEGILMSKRRVDKDSKFKVYLFSVNEHGMPGDTLFSKVVIQKELDKKDFLDIRDKELYIPANGIFIGFRWIESNKDFKEYLQINATKEGEYKKTLLHLYKDERIWMPIGTPEDIGNARFGLKMRRLD